MVGTMADHRQLSPETSRRPTARDLAVQLGLFLAMLAVVLVVQEAVYRASGWDRLWILLVVWPVAWAGKAAAQRWLARCSADGRGLR